MSHVYQRLATSVGVKVCLIDIVCKYAADSNVFRRGGRSDSWQYLGVSTFLWQTFDGRLPVDETAPRDTL